MITRARPPKDTQLRPTSGRIFGTESHKPFAPMFNHAYHDQLLIVTFIFVAMALVGCGVRAGGVDSDARASQNKRSRTVLQEEKHRLYSAALAASDSPLDTELFRDVCRQIEIFDADGNPNGNYMTFVQQHVAWGMNPENNKFRLEINTKEKAQQYLATHLR